MNREDRRQNSRPGDSPRVASFARRVLERVNHMPGQVRAARLESFSAWLAEYVSRSSGYEQRVVFDEADRLRMSRDDLVIHCVPRAAGLLGQRWNCNELSFALVSMASARLFGVIRCASETWDNKTPLERGLSLLICTLDVEDHLIGTSVLAYQLRESGHSVCSLVKAEVADIVEKLDVGHFDGLLFSCSTLSSLETVTQAVKHIRTAACIQPMIVLGGSVLHEVDGLKDKTGVDLVTNDINSAVAHLNRGIVRGMREVAE